MTGDEDLCDKGKDIIAINLYARNTTKIELP